MKFPLILLVLIHSWLAPAQADAQNLIKREGAHTQYDVELEPHFAFSDHSFGWGWGPGVRATWIVAEKGFIDRLNDSVGIGVGGDLLFDDREHCHGQGNNRYCHGDGRMQLLVPVAMQWNFWFTKQWSAYAEAGLAVRFREHGTPLAPLIAVGGRLQLNAAMALTLRLGSPEVTLGLSFFL